MVARVRGRRPGDRRPDRLWHAFRLDSSVEVTPVLLALSWLLLMNVVVLGFNLIPAFPLDGGRIVRAIVWRVTGDKRRGTRAAATLGQGFAVILAGFGICLMLQGSGAFSGLWLIVLAFLLGQSARGALVQNAVTERIDGSPRAGHHGPPAGGDSRRHARRERRSTSTSCATAGRGSRSSTPAGGSWGSPARSACRRPSTAVRLAPSERRWSRRRSVAGGSSRIARSASCSPPSPSAGSGR